MAALGLPALLAPYTLARPGQGAVARTARPGRTRVPPQRAGGPRWEDRHLYGV